MKYGSLFSGIGGIDLGLDRAGMVCAWQVEQNPYCLKVLEKHWPNVPRLTDVRDVHFDSVEPVDLICGGFPCQDVSVAGKRKGLSGERSGLWFEFLRILRDLRPRYALVENVPGLFTSNGGRDFGTILGGLSESGYDAEWRVISAREVGAWHLRKRLFIVAYATGQSSNGVNQHGNSQKTHGEDPIRSCEPSGRFCSHVSNAERTGLEIREVFPADLGEKLAATERAHRTVRGVWAVEPDIRRVVNGIPSRVDRLRALGNAVVPQVAELIGRLIMEHAK